MPGGLDFEIAAPVRAQAAGRADVACFIGYVGRRRDMALPAAVRAQLREAGWIDGPWGRRPARLESLWQLPVVIESWDQFDRLYAWDQRPLHFDGSRRCATYLGAAVRSFFAQGGRRAVVIRVADPWPYLEGDNRVARRMRRLAHLVPALRAAPRPFEPGDPARWRGIEHLYGLSEVSHLCLPDLADACSCEPLPPSVINPPPPPPEVFVECSADEPAAPADDALRFISAPRCDAGGYAAWCWAADAVRDFLARHRRDALLLASLPLPTTEARVPTANGAFAEADWLAFLRGNGVLEAEGINEAGSGTAASAFIQLLWPWLRTTRADDLPETLEPADGLMAGRLATNALSRGTYRSVAGSRLADVVAAFPKPDIGTGGDSPGAQLAQRVCLIGPQPDGHALLSDVTSTPDITWRAGGVSRLMANLLRAARRSGEAHMFEANGEQLWIRIRRSLEQLLEGWRRAGALESRGDVPAYQVRCGRDTMSQNDLDNGRVRVEITVQPVVAIERITVAFDLAGGHGIGQAGAPAGAGLQEVA